MLQLKAFGTFHMGFTDIVRVSAGLPVMQQGRDRWARFTGETVWTPSPTAGRQEPRA